ncbi:MAG: hypothetical protein AB2551_01685 [Candidatus Thiodiazotropha sp.]
MKGYSSCVISKIPVIVLLIISIVGIASADQSKRPMNVHQLEELGIEVWTEFDPLWITELKYHGKKPVFTAQTPPNVYPPAAMSIVTFRGMALMSDELKDVATTAIRSGAKNYKVSDNDIQRMEPYLTNYGNLVGYESNYRGMADGNEVDVKVFVGHKQGEGPIMMQIYTLKDKLPHIKEQIRRSWTNITYLN